MFCEHVGRKESTPFTDCQASAPYLHEIVKMQAAIEEYNATAKRLADEEAEQRRIAESLRKEAVNLYKAWGITGEIVDDHDWDRRIASRKAMTLENQIGPRPRYSSKVSRCTSHFYRGTSARVCRPLGSR